MKHLKVTRTVVLEYTVPFNEEYYRGLTEEQAIKYEESANKYGEYSSDLIDENITDYWFEAFEPPFNSVETTVEVIEDADGKD